MKKLLLLLLFCFSLNGIAQTITFDYDLAGNQTKRVYNSFGNRIKNEDIKEYKDLVKNDLQKFFPEDVISYYPNPVKDELYLTWELVNENKVSSIDIYAITGQIIKTINNLTENKIVVSFQEYNTGTYLVNLNYTSGDQKSITIIKN
jgi:hypothetical protein